MMRTIADTKPTRPPKNPGRSFRKMATAIDSRELKKQLAWERLRLKIKNNLIVPNIQKEGY